MARLGADHVNLQPERAAASDRASAFRCSKAGGGWRDQAGIAVHVETHRDRMTTDLFFTLQLLDCFPDLRLTADVSHYLVGREFAWPVDEVNHAMIHRILDNSWGIHGRIASREQVQISLGFPQHQGWVDLFMGWWEYAIRSWRRARRARRGADLPVRTRPAALRHHRRRRRRAVGPLGGRAGHEGHDPGAVAAHHRRGAEARGDVALRPN